ncbi:UDP-N-acetylglucosamine transferase subunit ALG14 [Prochlorococcus sp. AH-716-M06]|nr:UDP-N-acetylglucosamine transferase subunit ALG14 [Prochlorococcus sp. AH-716-M06]
MTKICVVSSSGGHLTEIRTLKNIYQNYPHFYIINSLIKLPKDMSGISYFISHSERDFKFFYNIFECFLILLKEKPDLIISTGAGAIVPCSFIGKIFRIKILYIETITRIKKPSLTGRIMYYLSDCFIYQWKDLKKYFPKGIYGGQIL